MTRILRAAVLAAVLAGCGGEGPDSGYDHYFSARGYNEATCNVPDLRLKGRREVRIFTQGVDAPVFTRSLQRYYLRYGLTFFSTQPIQVVDQKYALDTDNYELNKLLMTKFPGVAVDDASLMALMTKDPALYDQIVKVVMNFVYRPLIDFARTHAAGTQLTNLVMVPQILRDDSADLSTGGDVVGLAISPALLRRFDAMDIEEGSMQV